MNERKPQFTRLHALLAMLSVVLAAYLAVLVDIQIVHHEEYLAQSTRSITRVEAVEASRGILTDRSGRTLVSNRSTYSLTFDASLLKEGEDPHDAILRLVELCRDEGVVWEDNLPLTITSPSRLSVDSLSDQQKTRFLSYLKDLKPAAEALRTYLSAHPELLEAPEDEAAEAAESVPAQTDSLDHLAVGRLNTALLLHAGITATQLTEWMRADWKLSEDYTENEARLILGVLYELELRKLGTNTAYVLAEDIDISFISLLSDGNYAGAKVGSSSVREYETTYASHILGTVSRIYKEDLETLEGKGYDGDDWIGREGAEKAFEPYLKGTDGRRVVSVNDSGKITGEYYSQEPQPGNTVELTIDLTLQQAVEGSLAETVLAMNEEDGEESRGAGAAVIRVGSGEVMALASFPTFDLSTYREEYSTLSNDPAKPLFNRATQGTYAPGSTIKPLTAAAALESGVIDTTQKIRDTGKWVYPNYAASYTYCWKRSGHGPLNVSQAITHSCNYFFAEMGYRMGLATLNEYYSAFGLGQHTGIEIGDAAGLLPSQEAGHDMSPWAAYGQADQLYSPIQLANYIATLVSGGRHYDAHLLKAVRSYDGTELVAQGNSEPVDVIHIADSSLAAIKKGMHDLTTSTLAPYFRDCVVTAGAKTGTAQISAETENNGVFVCFAPYEEPEIAVAIVIEKGGSGAALASTAVDILNAYFAEDDIGSVILPENALIP